MIHFIKLYHNKTKDVFLKDLEYYIELGKRGVYPLFFDEWIKDLDLSQLGKKSYLDKDLLIEQFKKLSVHSNIDKKKIALSALTKSERDELILSFFKEIDKLIFENEFNSH